MSIADVHRKQTQVAIGRGINIIIFEIMSVTTIMLLVISFFYTILVFLAFHPLKGQLSCMVLHTFPVGFLNERVVCEVSLSGLENPLSQ